MTLSHMGFPTVFGKFIVVFMTMITLAITHRIILTVADNPVGRSLLTGVAVLAGVSFVIAAVWHLKTPGSDSDD